MRINEVPHQFRLRRADREVLPAGRPGQGDHRRTTDERFTPLDVPPANGEPAGPYLLVVTAQGQTLRMPLSPFRTASTKVGRRYVRLVEGDKVVLATVLASEESLFLASASGHVIHFPIEEINILSGAGKGVMGIKLQEGDVCLGGALISNRNDALVVDHVQRQADGVPPRQARADLARRQGVRGGQAVNVCAGGAAALDPG